MIFLGCKSNPKEEPDDPLNGIHQFEVVLSFSSLTGLDKESFLKTIVSSFEKIGNVRFSKKDICSIEGGLPVLLLSLEMADEHQGSISVFAEAEILINHCRIGSQIWKLDFNGKKDLILPEIEGDNVVFRRKQQYKENLTPILLQEKMIEQFAKSYWKTNSIRPTFYIHSNFLH